MPSRVAITLLVLAVPIGGIALAGDDHAVIVERAFAALAQDFERDWAYTETKVVDGRTWVGRWDPRADESPWRLLSVDGQQPTDAERDEWLAEQPLPGSNDGDDADMVTPGSLVLLEETPDAWRFGFVPSDAGDEDAAAFMKEVDGSLRIMRDGPWLAELLLENRGPVRPATGVKITQFETRLAFAPAVPGGPVVPRAIDVHVKGRAYLAIGFEERETTRYSDYEFAGSGENGKMVPDR